MLGSLLCDYRARLDAALRALVAEDAGVLLYTKEAATVAPACTRERTLNAPLAAGLLRRAGVSALRLGSADARLAAGLRANGIDVVEPDRPARVAA